MSRKHTTVRSSAAVTAALLMAALTAGPAMADHDHGQGRSRDHGQQAAAHRQGPRDQSGDDSRGRSQSRADNSDRNSAKGAAGGREDRGEDHEERSEGRGDERGNGHTPVTVCHLLGNGGYHLLTMDDNALSAHLGHGDVYPDAEGTCPAPTAASGAATTSRDSEETTASGDVTEETTASGDVTEEITGTVAEGTSTGAVVAGEEAFAGGRGTATTGTTTRGRSGTVAGVEATRGANRAAPVAGPLAGILPQTGAGAVLSGALLGGLGLVAGGAVLVARRRQGAL